MANIEPFFPTGAYLYVTENDVLTPLSSSFLFPSFFSGLGILQKAGCSIRTGFSLCWMALFRDVLTCLR